MVTTTNKVIACCPQTANKTDLLEYTQTQGFANVEFIPEPNTILAQVHQGDVVIFDRVTSIGNVILHILEFLQAALAKKVVVHIVVPHFIVHPAQPDLTALVSGLIESERLLISNRAKAANAKRKINGSPIGRPKGSTAKILPLDKRYEEFFDLALNKNMKVTAISRLMDCPKSSLYQWIDNRNIPRHFPTAKWSEAEIAAWREKMQQAKAGIAERLAS